MKDKIEISMKKVVLLSVIMVTITASLVGLGTYAYFSASQVSGVNDFFTGSIQFSINGADPWSGNFNATLKDIKPGKIGWGNITVRNTGENRADLWMMITNVTNTSYGTNSAKSAEPASTSLEGVINYGVYNYTTTFPSAAYVDPYSYTVGDGSHQLGGITTGVRDNWTYLGRIDPGVNVYVNQSFGMNATTTNWAQLMNMTFTVNFYAQQSEGTPQPSAPTPQLASHARV